MSKIDEQIKIMNELSSKFDDEWKLGPIVQWVDEWPYGVCGIDSNNKMCLNMAKRIFLQLVKEGHIDLSKTPYSGELNKG